MSPEHELQNDRRSFMKLLAAAPLFASLGARSLAAMVSPPRPPPESSPPSPRDWNNNIYTRFGIRPSSTAAASSPTSPPQLELPQVAQGRRRGLPLLHRPV